MTFVDHQAGAADGGDLSDGRAASVCIAVTGNCQAMFVASVLNTLPGVEAIFFAGPYRHVRYAGQAAATEPAARRAEILNARKAAGATIVLCEQTSPVAPVTEPETVGAPVDLVIRFPNLQAYALWPSKLYSADQMARLTPERMHRIDRASNAAGIAKANVDVAGFVDAHFGDQILFDSPQHPSSVMMAEIVSAVLNRLAAVVPPEPFAALVRGVAASRGINTVFQHPVEPGITEALDCRWSRTRLYKLWGAVNDDLAQKNFEAAARDASALLARIDDEPFFGRMIEPDVWALLATCRYKLGDQPAAIDAADRAVAADPENPTRHAVRAFQFLLERSPADAISAYRKASALNPDSQIYPERIAALLAKTGDLDQAVSCLQEIGGAKKRNPKALKTLAAIEMRRAIEALDRSEAALGRARGSGSAHARQSLQLEARAIQELIGRVSDVRFSGTPPILKRAQLAAAAGGNSRAVARAASESAAQAKNELRAMTALALAERFRAAKAVADAKAAHTARLAEEAAARQAIDEAKATAAVARAAAAAAAKAKNEQRTAPALALAERFNAAKAVADAKAARSARLAQEAAARQAIDEAKATAAAARAAAASAAKAKNEQRTAPALALAERFNAAKAVADAKAARSALLAEEAAARQAIDEAKATAAAARAAAASAAKAKNEQRTAPALALAERFNAAKAVADAKAARSALLAEEAAARQAIDEAKATAAAARAAAASAAKAKNEQRTAPALALAERFNAAKAVADAKAARSALLAEEAAARQAIDEAKATAAAARAAAASAAKAKNEQRTAAALALVERFNAAKAVAEANAARASRLTEEAAARKAVDDAKTAAATQRRAKSEAMLSRVSGSGASSPRAEPASDDDAPEETSAGRSLRKTG